MSSTLVVLPQTFIEWSAQLLNIHVEGSSISHFSIMLMLQLHTRGIVTSIDSEMGRCGIYNLSMDCMLMVKDHAIELIIEQVKGAQIFGCHRLMERDMDWSWQYFICRSIVALTAALSTQLQ